MRNMIYVCCLVAASISGMAAADMPRVPVVTAAEAGLDGSRLANIDTQVAGAMKAGKMPGAVVCVGHQGKIGWLKAYGNRRVEPSVEPMTVDTVFDMASLTKPVATATSIMMLVERGQLRIMDKVSKHTPDFSNEDKGQVTIYDLLTHQGGLIPDNALKDYDHGVEEAYRRIDNLKFYVPRGSKFVYTDVGFIQLARLVETLTGQNVHQFSQQNLFGPLGMTETGYAPADSLRARAATTEQREGRWMRGEVHDPRAYRLGGIAGHAGLFSTAQDMAVYAQMMLNGGQYGGKRLLHPRTVAKMTDSYEVSSGQRGLGWDKQTGYSSNKGELMSSRAFGHGGFTGTSMWVDPELDMFVIFLSNRVHPNGKGYINHLAGRIGSIAVSSILPATETGGDAEKTAAQTPAVQNGIDVLRASKFDSLRGQRLGVITNHTGLAADGTPTYELLHKHSDVDLRVLFSPEHGFAGKLDVSGIGDSTDASTGLKIFSLYGKTRTPTAESLQDLDTLVFDIQDIGARFYTYISTMGNAMKAAAEHDVRFVVLDRPNPIGGQVVAGPVLDPGLESFVGYHTLATRHGMTVGEIAKMLRAELKLDVQLEVVPVKGWDRDMYFDRTGQRWVDPSPNMRNLTQAVLYPGIGLLETTNVSVGRGTDTPFEILGAPWIDELRLAAALNARGLPGVRFVPRRFTPDSSKFKGEQCGGVNIVVTDRSRLQTVQVGLEIARQLRILFPNDWQMKSFNRLLCDQAVRDAVERGDSLEQIVAGYQAELQLFRQRRAKYLMY